MSGPDAAGIVAGANYSTKVGAPVKETTVEEGRSSRGAAPMLDTSGESLLGNQVEAPPNVIPKKGTGLSGLNPFANPMVQSSMTARARPPQVPQQTTSHDAVSDSTTVEKASQLSGHRAVSNAFAESLQLEVNKAHETNKKTVGDWMEGFQSSAILKNSGSEPLLESTNRPNYGNTNIYDHLKAKIVDALADGIGKPDVDIKETITTATALRWRVAEKTGTPDAGHFGKIRTPGTGPLCTTLGDMKLHDGSYRTDEHSKPYLADIKATLTESSDGKTKVKEHKYHSSNPQAEVTLSTVSDNGEIAVHVHNYRFGGIQLFQADPDMFPDAFKIIDNNFNSYTDAVRSGNDDAAITHALIIGDILSQTVPSWRGGESVAEWVTAALLKPILQKLNPATTTEDILNLVKALDMKRISHHTQKEFLGAMKSDIEKLVSGSKSQSQ